MANRKINPKKLSHEKTILEKIGDQASHLKDEIVAGKDHLVEMASDAFTSVKSTITDLTAKKKERPAPKKATTKTLKKAASKSIRPTIKKIKSGSGKHVAAKKPSGK